MRFSTNDRVNGDRADGSTDDVKRSEAGATDCLWTSMHGL